jgi:hypothetical protein
MNNQITDSFVLTLTYNGKAVIFRLVTTPALQGAYEVTAINDKDFSPFLMQQAGKAWLITTEVPAEMEALQHRLSTLINAYREGQGM